MKKRATKKIQKSDGSLSARQRFKGAEEEVKFLFNQIALIEGTERVKNKKTSKELKQKLPGDKPIRILF